MKKCGDLTLREYFINGLNVELLLQGINIYKDLQKATINITPNLIAAGVPNWRLVEEKTFDGWLDKKQQTNEALSIAKTLQPLYLLFAQKRFLDSINLPYNVEDPISVKQHDKIKRGFTWLIDNIKLISN